MTLFTCFDMIVENKDLLDSDKLSIEFSQLETKTLDQAATDLSHSTDDNQCPDSDHCPDCHECHMGHCGILVTSNLIISTITKSSDLIQRSEIYSSRDFSSVFRPPIKA